jgi:hypothetical protein
LFSERLIKAKSSINTPVIDSVSKIIQIFMVIDLKYSYFF